MMITKLLYSIDDPFVILPWLLAPVYHDPYPVMTDAM